MIHFRFHYFYFYFFSVLVDVHLSHYTSLCTFLEFYRFSRARDARQALIKIEFRRIFMYSSVDDETGKMMMKCDFNNLKWCTRLLIPSFCYVASAYLSRRMLFYFVFFHSDKKRSRQICITFYLLLFLRRVFSYFYFSLVFRVWGMIWYVYSPIRCLCSTSS